MLHACPNHQANTTMPIPEHAREQALAETQLSQQEFDRKYLTTTDIMEQLGVSRAAVFYARERGQLPPPIRLKGCQVFIWDRRVVADALEKWAESLNTKRV